MANAREGFEKSWQAFFGAQSANDADHECIGRQFGRARRIERTKRFEIDAVVAELDLPRRHVLIALEVAADEIAIHDDGVSETIRHADQFAVFAWDEVAMRALAGSDGDGGEETRGRDGENGGRIVEGVDQANPMTADVSRELECTGGCGRGKERAHRKMGDGDAGVFKFAPAGVIRTKAADVGTESRTVERFGDLSQLPFAASGFERASHEQDGPLHEILVQHSDLKMASVQKGLRDWGLGIRVVSY